MCQAARRAFLTDRSHRNNVGPVNCRLTTPTLGDRAVARGRRVSTADNARCDDDNAAVANETYAQMGAIKPLYSPAIPDYHSTLPEAKVPYGRTLQIDRGDGEMGKGDVLTAQLLAAAEWLGVHVLYEQRVEGVV